MRLHKPWREKAERFHLQGQHDQSNHAGNRTDVVVHDTFKTKKAARAYGMQMRRAGKMVYMAQRTGKEQDLTKGMNLEPGEWAVFSHKESK